VGFTTLLERCELLQTLQQLLPFHPEFIFPDAPPDCPSHFTNRTPWPTFQLLQEELLSSAIEAYRGPDSANNDKLERIYQTNIATMRAVGQEHMKKLLSEFQNAR